MKLIRFSIIISAFLFMSFSYASAEVKVMIDPGHGGYDSGAISHDKKYEEKDLNLDTAIAVKNKLEKHGVTVYMTREDDRFVSLQDRSDMANRIKDLDVLISVHHNSSKNKSIYRTEVIYQAKHEKEAQKLAEAISKKLATINDELKIYTRYNKEGSDYYSILRRTNTVSNIVEVSFISSEEGYALVDTHEKRVRNGELVAEGVMDYLGISYSEESKKEDNTFKIEKNNKRMSMFDRLFGIINSNKNENKGVLVLREILNRGE